MKIAIGSDHAGVALKRRLVSVLKSAGDEVLDLGAPKEVPTDDYPDYAAAVAVAVGQGKAERGIVICGSGVGACIVANKFPGIRAAQCPDLYTARQSVEHDDVNVLCLGARTMNGPLTEDILKEWLAARFSGEARHVRRLGKLDTIEKQNFK
jgi:ribose 5-phosphate isomerase B